MADTTTWTPISAPTDFQDDAVFNIDFKTKTVQVLVEQPIVAGENLSQFIKFQAPRFYDNIDLTEMSVNIIYVSPAGNKGISAAVNTEYSEDMIRCGWLVPYAACPEKGTLHFVLEFVGADYTLKTTVASTPVLDSINDADVVPEPAEQAWYIALQDNVSSILQAASDALEKAQGIVNALATPQSAALESEMSVPSAVYVYTGSEDGYTYGDWYFHNGSTWVPGGHYVSTDYLIDSTLTQSGQAADAKETGKIKTAVTDLGLNQNLGYLALAHEGKGLSNNTEFSNQWLSYTDYIEIPIGAISITVRTLTKTTSDVEYNITPFVYVYDEDYNVLYSYGDTTLAEEKTRSLKFDGAKYVRVVQPSEKALKTKYIKFNMYDAESADNELTFFGGYITQDNYQDFFTDANDAPLNKAYGIQAVIDPAMIANLPEYHMATQANFITLCGRHPSEGNGNMNNLQIYSVGSGGRVYIRSSNFDRTVWSKWAEIDITSVYHVGSDKEYTSFTQCLYDLRNDKSKKIIYVDGGIYDIAQEYIDAGIPVIPDDGDYNNNYTPYNVWIPENTHVIGLGNVVLRYMPSASAVTEAQSKTVSPLNVHKTCTVENVTVECKNGRYCLHADGQGDNAYSNANIRLKNVHFIHYVNDTDRGWGEVVGIGLDKQQTLIFEDCVFESERTTGGANFYAHNRNLVGGVALTKAESSTLICKNCVFIQPGDTSNLIRLASAVTTNLLQIGAKFINCYIGGTIHLMERTTGAPNCFDVTLLKSGNPTVVIDDANNTYPVKVYQ